MIGLEPSSNESEGKPEDRPRTAASLESLSPSAIDAIGPDLVKQWAQLRMAHEGFMLDKIMKEQKIARDNAKALQKEAGQDVSKEDDMGVSIGNTYSYNSQSEPEAEPPKPEPVKQSRDDELAAMLKFMQDQQGQKQEVQTKSSPSTMPSGGKSFPWAVPASVLAAGAMIGGGAYLGMQNSKPDPSQPVQVRIDNDKPIDTITKTQVTGSFGKPATVHPQ